MAPQETDPDLSVSVQESLAEVWVDSGLLDLLSGPGLICILSTNLSTSHLADYFCVQVEVERSLPPGRLP